MKTVIPWMIFQYLKRNVVKNTAPKGIDFVKNYCKIKDKDILSKPEDIPYFELDNEYVHQNQYCFGHCLHCSRNQTGIPLA